MVVHERILRQIVMIAGFCLATSVGAAVADEPRRLTHDGHFKQRPQWSPDGAQLLFTRHRGSTIAQFVWHRSTEQEQRLGTRSEPEFDGTWSPQGKWIAFTFDKTSPNQGNQELYVCDVEGQQLRLLSGDRGVLSHEEWPSFSPDGSQLVYVSTRYGNPEVCSIPFAGGEERRLTNDPALEAHPAWSPDGSRIALATNRWGDWELALLDVASGDVRRLTTSPGLDDYPAWSPDGRRLAFTSNRDGNLEIYLVDLISGKLTNLTHHAAIDNFPAWCSEDRLTWVSNRGAGFDLYEMSLPARHVSGDERAPK